MTKKLPTLIWLIAPVLLVCFPYVARIINLSSDQIMYGEFGVIENVTVIFLFTAIIAALLFLLNKSKPNFKLFHIWMVIFLLGAIYYAGEEISWGQHYFGWATPEQWSSVNDQQETNLHNTSPLFDQIPRTLLSLAALIGGVFVPLYRQYKGHIPSKDSIYDWIWPTIECLPAALFSMLVSWHEKLYELIGTDIPQVLDIRAGETKEMFLAMFMMVYALSVWNRNRNVNH